MLKALGGVLILLGLCVSATPGAQEESQGRKSGPAPYPGGGAKAVLWHDPTDMETRNLLYGSGGEDHQPHGTFTFVAEDTEGTNPKLDVRDQDGVKWKVKLGPEARPEVAASRFLWAAGYFTQEDTFSQTCTCRTYLVISIAVRVWSGPTERYTMCA
jgi:hypothetical protein